MAGKPHYAVGLDAGSRRTRLAICVLESGRLRLVGYGAAESDGWTKGDITDQRAVADSISRALGDAEASSGIPVESAVVGIGGPRVRGANARGVLDMGYLREIEQRDVSRVVERAARVQLLDDRMLLQLFPQDFVVDEHPGHRDPRNMLASRLEVNVHLITGSIQQHTTLIGAVNQAHVMVEETVFEPLAACYAAVLPDERREGVAVVDIGAHSTGMVVYYGDAMHLASTMRVCGDHFTRDLAQALCLGFDEAELVKMEYGSALANSCQDNIHVELPSPETRQRRETTRRFVSQVLEARAHELFQFIRSELSRIGMEHALLGGVFLTGAAARLPDLCDVAEGVLQCQTRFGLAAGIRDWPDELNDPEWAVAAGLAMYSAKLRAKTEHEREAVGWLARVLK